MNEPGTGAGRRSTLLSVAALAAVLVIGWFVYRPALSGTFLLDDVSNLGDLDSVSDSRSALQFVLSGTAGPLGRPVALATFAAQASSWPSGAGPFIAVNICTHLVNGLLLYLFLQQLSVSMKMGRRHAGFVAVAATAAWLLMPLLASSSLMIVQRMTTLSATFVLAGLATYLFARRRIEDRPRRALLGMSLALVLATLLAALTKENGALLPVLVLVLEATLLQKPESLSPKKWRTWTAVFLLAPALLIVALLIGHAAYDENMIARRGFTAWQRLLTESRILWEYLVNAFVARTGEYGPFHDDYAVARSLLEPVTLLAAAGWLSLVTAAIALRRRYPVAAFAVLWFVAGHLLESTTVPLELYFEHRNYIPIVGPVFALCFAVAKIGGTYRYYARAGLGLLILVNAGVLLSITSLWGKPLQAATYWHVQRPNSIRAATTLAERQLTEMGPSVAAVTLKEVTARRPEHAYLRIPALNLACIVAPERDRTATIDYLESHLPSIAFSYTAGQMLDQLLTTAAAGTCCGVDPDVVRALAVTIADNPLYHANTGYQHFHHKLMARIAWLSGDVDGTLGHLAQAIEIRPDDDLNIMTVTTLVAANRFDEAHAFIESAVETLPAQPLRRYGAIIGLAELKTYVTEAERLAQSHDVLDTDGSTEND